MEERPEQGSVQAGRDQGFSLTIPMAIIIAGLFIAVSIYMSKSGGNLGKTIDQVASVSTIQALAPSKEDRILGTLDANVILIDYSDTECPICKQNHILLKKLMDEYGKDGKLAWIYRHFPLYRESEDSQALHPKAGKEAEALECALELGGIDTFWKYTNRIFEITPSNNQLDPGQLPIIASYSGLDVASFKKCLDSGKYAEDISRYYDQAETAGATGTPYTVLVSKKEISKSVREKIVKDIRTILQQKNKNAEIPSDLFTFDEGGKMMSWSGLFPYSIIKSVIENLI